MPDDALIHLRVPAGLKARWVRESRAASMRLTDWVVTRVERTMPRQIAIIIPANVPFSSLRLSRAADGSVELDWTPIEAICRANGVDVGIYRDSHEDHLAGLLTAWYRQHLAAGGEPDATMDDLIAEVQIEDAHGQHTSHQPGRA